MEDGGVRQVAKISLASARSCLSKKRYGRAFANFLLFLKLVPENHDDVLEDFIMTMRLWTENLEREGRIEDLFKCFDQACEILPDNESILNNIGAQLFRLGYAEEAVLYIRKSLHLNPEYLAARENLENICSHLVERWHFRMLNDVRRNCAYRSAIQTAVQSGYHTVLDIGTGSGILSLFAVESGAGDVTACEKSKTMFEIAQDVLRENSVLHKVRLVRELSTDLTMPNDLPGRVSLVVTETFDAALFGEHIISTLQHAWKDLLMPPTSRLRSKVIPSGATLYICAVESEAIRTQNRFLYPGLHKLDMGGVGIVCTTGTVADEPYTTENLTRLRRGYKMLSEPSLLTCINFNDPLELDIIANGIEWQATLPITTIGKLDAIVFWFDLHLDDEISITTNPSMETCWEQAVFPVLPSHFHQSCCGMLHDTQHGFIIRDGDSLHVKFSLGEDCLWLVSCHCCHDSDDSAPYMPLADFICPPQVTEQYLLERTEIDKLNNLYYNKMFCQAIDKHLSQLDCADSLRILDFSGGLSPLCLQMLKDSDHHCVVIAREGLHDVIWKLMSVNDIDRDRLQLVEPSNLSEVEGDCQLILCDIIEQCGILKQQVLEDIALLRATCLSAGGIIVPGRVTIHGLCVESEMLHGDSAVINERTLGYNIAKYMNNFQMTKHVDIDLSTLSHVRLSDPFVLMQFDLNERLSSDEPPSFLEQTQEVKVTMTDVGHLTAVVYWFEFEMAEGLRFTTLDGTSHWKQAAVMLKSSTEFTMGQTVDLNVCLKNSCISIKIDKQFNDATP
ncbi:protein arginine N-methyltransferase 9-like [Ylistrum balloti]|uniref:protein arginine N-methyltransferase 9-like n=1 Tax=Ylistrum balloti TaxID=509963 RepID=UPI0029059CB2|nr:protein arginine N-methyltransferase 9-like [Ylistrum balloti]